MATKKLTARITDKEHEAEKALLKAACAFVDCKAGNSAAPYYDKMYRARKRLAAIRAERKESGKR